MKIIPVLLAGGIGERFWPMSRSTRPKQLLPLISKKSMIEETLARVRAFSKRPVNPLIVTGQAIAKLVRKTVPFTTAYDVIVEPVGKNTAPAVAAAAAWVEKKYGESVMAVLSADHAISPASAFVDAVRFAARMAEKDNALVVFGIRPSRPDTGYGYVQLGKETGAKDDLRAYRVRRFVEKPGPAKARSYVKSGKYLWNSGMFVWKTSVILEELKIHMPGLYELTERLSRSKFLIRDLEAFYQAAEKESIDYGIMEKSSRVAVVCPSFSWDDIGSWESMSRIHGVNEANTTVVGSGVYESGCENAIIVNDSDSTIAAFGVRDIAVVTTRDSVMVIPRSALPDLKKYVAAMKRSRSVSSKLF